MIVNQHQQFHQFATSQIRGDESFSLEELVAAWADNHFSEEELDRSAAGIQQAIDDMNAGDRGRPAREAIDAIRVKHGLA